MKTDFSHLNIKICYKNFAACQGVSHIGLGVSAINAVKVLRHLGIEAEVVPLKEENDLRKFLNLSQSNNEKPVTHAIVSAPWMSTNAWSQLSSVFPNIKFAMNCHSNVGFLQADTNGIRRIREALSLEMGTHNFKVTGNSKRFCKFIENAYGQPCAWLPNLYYLNHMNHSHRPGWPVTGGVLRIGAFGAGRGLKNFLSAIGASIEVSHELKAVTEIYVSTEREDGPDSARILSAGKALLAGLPNITLKQTPWCPWPEFRKVVRHMHVLLQPSYTESFNMVTADGAAEGVPSVVSESITWAPEEWKTEVDDVFSIAKTAIKLINDCNAARDGFKALKHHNHLGIKSWLNYLSHLDPLNQEHETHGLLGERELLYS